MTKKKNIYWTCQIIGWIFFPAINLFFFRLNYNTTVLDILNFLIWVPVGIMVTHTFRYFIIRYNILKLKLFKQITILIIASVVMAFFYFLLTVGLAKIFGILTFRINLVGALSTIFNCTWVFVFWSLIYFGFHFFDNYKKTEIQNLRLEANNKEVELNKLKSQLNPHFMFNCMNSIRALVDEDPKKAKVSITQLSNILRNTLLMNKNKFNTLEEELALVKDYLELEHIRYEERLRFTFEIDPTTLQKHIPPMMIQTLVENGIKHGISKYPEGGEIIIKTKLLDNIFKIEILNTGQMENKISETGVGLANTTNRLELLFGKAASFSLKNLDNNTVLSEIIINLK